MKCRLIPYPWCVLLTSEVSTDPEIIQKVRSYADGVDRVLASLDSNHTHEHVLAELNAYADLVSVCTYCIVSTPRWKTSPQDPSPIAPGSLATIPKWLFMNGLRAILSARSIRGLTTSY